MYEYKDSRIGGWAIKLTALQYGHHTYEQIYNSFEDGNHRNKNKTSQCLAITRVTKYLIKYHVIPCNIIFTSFIIEIVVPP